MDGWKPRALRVAEWPAVFIGRRFFASGSQSRLASFISLLAMTGLVLGVSLLIVVLAVMNGFDKEMRTRILGLVPHVQLFEVGGIANWPDLAAQLHALPEVREATPFTSFNGMLMYRGEMEAAQIQGLDPAALDSAMATFLPGEKLANLDTDHILLSSTLAQRLGVVEGNKLTLLVPRMGAGGQQLTPQLQALTVTAIFNTHTAEDGRLVIVHLATAGSIVGIGERPAGLRITLEDVFQAREFGYSLIHRLSGNFSFIDWLQTHGNLYQAIQLSRQLVGLLIFLIIAIAVFNIISMLVMTVVDKKPAIAILKTLGASNPRILAIFLVQGSLIGLWGTFLGIALGIPGALYVSELVAGLESLLEVRFLSAEIYPIDYLPSDLHGWDVAAVAATALGLNFVATLYPAWKAVGTRPAEVLRYE